MSLRRRRVGTTRALAAAALLASPGALLSAQVRSPSALQRSSVQAAAVSRSVSDQPASWWAPLASLALPGAGQSVLKQPRSVAYVAAEVFLVLQYVAANRDGNRDREAYRQLAADVARTPFGGPRPLGSWDYYELMERYLESGVYNRTPGAALSPETDPATYNGARWLLARQNFWANPEVAPPTSSPEYQRAIAFYQASAVTDAFRWSWRDFQLEQDLYRQTIRSANRSYQRATNLLGVVAANHLASLIDAYVTVRIRRYGGVHVAGRSLDGVTTGYAPNPLTGNPEFTLGLRAR
jgi:hypothetical protein